MSDLALTGRRRQIAMAVSESPRTLNETAKAIGASTSSIYRLVHRMVEDGVLEATDDPPTRGTLFSLNDRYVEQLEGAAVVDGMPGSLMSNQRVLFVDGRQRARLYRVLARVSLAAPVAWLAELDGSGQLLLALEPGASLFQQDRLLIALQRAELSATAGRIGEVVAGDLLRRAATVMDEFTEVPA